MNVLPDQRSLKQVIGQMNDGGHGNSNLHRKNSINTGIRIVPRPNPEKKVSIAAPDATRMMIKYSINQVTTYGWMGSCPAGRIAFYGLF